MYRLRTFTRQHSVVVLLTLVPAAHNAQQKGNLLKAHSELATLHDFPHAWCSLWTMENVKAALNEMVWRVWLQWATRLPDWSGQRDHNQQNNDKRTSARSSSTSSSSEGMQSVTDASAPTTTHTQRPRHAWEEDYDKPNLHQESYSFFSQCLVI